MADWSLTMGVRIDHYSDVGDTVNPRFALVWDTTYSLTTKFLYGKAFRPPSFAEKFNRNNPIAVGNSAIDPEVIDTYEIAFDYTLSQDIHLGLNLFYYEMNDIIKFSPEAQNTGDQVGRGIELEFEWKASRNLNIRGNYAFQDSKDKQDSSETPYAPQQQFYLQGDYRLTHQWSLNTQLHHVADRARAFGDLRPEIDNYTTIDFTVRGVEIMPGVDITVSVRNLTNEDASEPSQGSVSMPALIPGDLPLAGRSVFAQIRKTW